MTKTYRILHLEDVTTDAELAARELKKHHINFEHRVIDSEKEYIDALDNFKPDLILCDHSLPAFNSREALRIIKERKLHIPFILITATMSEDVAMNVLMEGADDYILKDRLKRLPHAVINVMEKYTFERERMKIIGETREKEANIKESEKINSQEREVLLNELTKSIKDLKQFTYITSHNFKAPLSNLKGLLSLIDNNTLCNNNKGIVDMFATATEQLNKTINDLVEILLIRSNVHVEVCNNNFAELVQHASNLLQLEINITGCTINQNYTVENIEFNQLYLESIFINLLSNAIKYRSPDRLLQLNISTCLNDLNEVILTFSDNGLGIDLNRHQDKIFGLYQRFHDNSEGIGLGLFIVKSQVTSMGGTIDISSQVNVGSTFTINFGRQSVCA